MKLTLSGLFTKNGRIKKQQSGQHFTDGLKWQNGTTFYGRREYIFLTEKTRKKYRELV